MEHTEIVESIDLPGFPSCGIGIKLEPGTGAVVSFMGPTQLLLTLKRMAEAMGYKVAVVEEWRSFSERVHTEVSFRKDAEAGFEVPPWICSQ